MNGEINIPRCIYHQFIYKLSDLIPYYMYICEFYKSRKVFTEKQAIFLN